MRFATIVTTRLHHWKTRATVTVWNKLAFAVVAEKNGNVMSMIGNADQDLGEELGSLVRPKVRSLDFATILVCLTITIDGLSV